MNPNPDSSFGREVYDLSFIYTYRCDLECPFCMYNSSPRIVKTLDINKLKTFLNTVNFNLIRSFGFYGGEIFVDLNGYSIILDLLPNHIQKWCITNGTWSKNKNDTLKFLSWGKKYRIDPIVVSSTKEHIKYQDRECLIKLSEEKLIQLKDPNEKWIPMGRLSNTKLTCHLKCETDKRPTRIAITPDETIIFQTCDGSYPVIGNISESFDNIHNKIQIHQCWKTCPFWRLG